MDPKLNPNLPMADAPEVVANGEPTDMSDDDANRPPPEYYPWPRVAIGQEGERVRTVQYLLRHHGFTVAVDGEFGEGTRAAVKEFQRKHRLSVTGYVDDPDWAAIASSVRKGEGGWKVRAVQSQLRESGYSVAVDGDFGDATENAVRRFQRANDITADGVVRGNTWNRLVVLP
jgi:peptidoglycan hydrolase-like protein with peptidoglycan-binding domain